jgi:hypothetical protein
MAGLRVGHAVPLIRGKDFGVRDQAAGHRFGNAELPQHPDRIVQPLACDQHDNADGYRKKRAEMQDTIVEFHGLSAAGKRKPAMPTLSGRLQAQAIPGMCSNSGRNRVRGVQPGLPRPARVRFSR